MHRRLSLGHGIVSVPIACYLRWLALPGKGTGAHHCCLQYGSAIANLLVPF